MTENEARACHRIVTFHKDLRGRVVMEIYLASPASKMPFFTAHVGREAVARFLDFLKASYEDNGNWFLVEDREDEVLRRLVIFAGVRQSFKALGEHQEMMLMSLVRNLTAVEALFWFSRFMLRDYATRPSNHDRRVARAFRILYGF